MDVLVYEVLPFLPVSNIVDIVRKDDEILYLFRKYVNSGNYMANVTGGLDISLLPDLESAILPFDYRCGYPRIYYLILELYNNGLLHKRPTQVTDMLVNILRSCTQRFHWENLDIDNPIRYDRCIALNAVTQNGLIIEYLSDRLKQDRRIVLAAAKQNGYALMHVSPNLRDDKGIALIAVCQNGLTLFHVSDRLKNDREIVKAAIRQNSSAIKYAKIVHKSVPWWHRFIYKNDYCCNRNKRAS